MTNQVICYIHRHIKWQVTNLPQIFLINVYEMSHTCHIKWHHKYCITYMPENVRITRHIQILYIGWTLNEYFSPCECFTPFDEWKITWNFHPMSCLKKFHLSNLRHQKFVKKKGADRENPMFMSLSGNPRGTGETAIKRRLTIFTICHKDTLF